MGMLPVCHLSSVAVDTGCLANQLWIGASSRGFKLGLATVTFKGIRSLGKEASSRRANSLCTAPEVPTFGHGNVKGAIRAVSTGIPQHQDVEARVCGCGRVYFAAHEC